MKFNKTAFFAMLFTSLFLSGFFFKASAEDDDSVGVFFGAKPNDFVKSRSYFGVIGTSSTLDQWGDFNGTNGFISIPSGNSDLEVDYVPEITRKYGWGVLVGQREGPWAIEVSFWRNDTTGSYFGAGVTTTNAASLSAINVDLKRYLFTELPTQPFVNIGMSFPWLWVRQFSQIWDPTLTTLLNTDDETISGIGFNLGAGLEIYLDKNFSILGGAYQRWTGFNQISGAAKIPFDNLTFDGNTANVGALEGDGLNIYAGATFGFE